jgi:hypothetical protein
VLRHPSTPSQTPRSTAAIMAHIDLAQGTGRLRLRDGAGYLNIQQLPWTVDRTHDRQCLASSNPSKWTVDRGPYSRQTMSSLLQPKNRQVRVVYRCSNLLENRHFSPLLGMLGVPSRRQSGLGMSLQQQEIGPEGCPPRRPRNPFAEVPENCNIGMSLRCRKPLPRNTLTRAK